MMDGWNMTGWGWMTLWTLVAIILIALFVTALLRASTTAAPSDSAMAELRLRYAAGEIDEAEFLKRRAALER